MRWLLIPLAFGLNIVCSGQTKTIKQIIYVENDVVFVSNSYIKDESCIDGPGEIDITVEGGSGLYEFSWTGPFGFTDTTEDINNLIEGEYSVTITDLVNGCSLSETYHIYYYCPYIGCNDTFALLSTTDTECALFNGEASFEVGISGDYDFTVIRQDFLTGTGVTILSGSSSGPETLDIPNLQQGHYFIEVSDAGGLCYYSTVFTIESTDFNFNTLVFNNNTQCIASPIGSINLDIANTLTPSDFQIRYKNEFTGTSASFTTSNSVETISNLRSGYYAIEVEHLIAGCKIQGNGQINNTSTLTVTGSTVPQTLCSNPNGAVDITVIGGSSDYVYTWSNGSNTQDISNVNFGFYSVAVVDNTSGCGGFNSFSVTDARIKPSLSFTIIDNSSCNSPFSGSIEVATSGSPGPFNYSWLKQGEGTPISTASGISGLGPGIYGLNITDVTSGCTEQVFPNEAGLVVNDNSAPEINITIAQQLPNTSCFGFFNGAIEIAIDLSPPQPYTISWTGPNGFTADNVEVLTDLEDGEYELTVETICASNSAPIIEANTLIPAPQGKEVSFNLLTIISDPDNNLDPSSIQIVQQPISGASAVVDFVSTDIVNLDIDYTGIIFSGTDQLRISVSDLLGLTTEQNIGVTGLNLTGELVIYNAVAADGNLDNRYLKIDNLPTENNQVIVYNRWGDEVLRINGYNNGTKGKRFEGLNKNGQRLPPGNYFYEIRILDTEPKTIRGYLSLK